MSDDNDSGIKPREVLELTSEIVAAHVSNNSVAMADLDVALKASFEMVFGD